jgi:hypothetical protein
MPFHSREIPGAFANPPDFMSEASFYTFLIVETLRVAPANFPRPKKPYGKLPANFPRPGLP